MPSEPTILASVQPIPLSVPSLRGNEWKYVKECLDTNWVSSVGPFVDRFEAMLSARLGSRCAVATVSGTAALHVALQVAGVEPDDEVIVSDLTFIASANAVRYSRAWPVFVDAEPRYWQMDVDKLRDFLFKDCEATVSGLRNRHTGRRVRALMPVHILGHPCDMAPILELANRFDLVVIEDAAEGLGALYRQVPVGHWGHIACFSFNGNKILTTGGGGMIVTDNREWAARARYLTTQAKDDPIEFIHGEIGYNYRLTNMQAALGCAQMEQLDVCIAEKRGTAKAYTEALSQVPGLTFPAETPDGFSTFWLYTILVAESEFGLSSRDLLRRLTAGGVQSRPLWQPMHRSPAHASAWATDCSVADRLNREALSLPCSVGLSDEQRQTVIRQVHQAAATGNLAWTR
jgi:perosamine synthetase